MIINEISLSNFRIFPAVETIVDLNNVPHLDHAEKSSILLALQKIFGETTEDNRVTAEDFNTHGTMTVSVKISFPEFAAPAAAAEPCHRQLFKYMQIGSDGQLFCRLSLSAFRHDLISSIEQHLYWELPGELHIPLTPAEHTIFTPAFLAGSCSRIICNE